MLSLAEAQAAIRARIQPGARTESVSLVEALGRFVAAPLAATVDNPAFDNSAMDGYALAQADLAARDFVLPVAGESSCGSRPQALMPGTAMRIFTGAPLPAGADTVVMQEDVVREGERACFPRTTTAGEQVRRRGEDFRAGDSLYMPGRRLAAHDVALLSAAGVAAIAVTAKPRVLVVATGDELMAPGQPLAAGQIYESNRIATLLLLAQLGAEAVDGGTVRDDPAALRALLARSSDCDFIITSGGASVGDHDLVQSALGEIGLSLDFWKIAMRPGKPLMFGKLGPTPLLGLPGNPVSAMVCSLLFLAPILAKFLGRAETEPRRIAARLGAALKENDRREDYLRAALARGADGAVTATPFSAQDSSMMATLAKSGGLIVRAPLAPALAAGDGVEVIPFADSAVVI